MREKHFFTNKKGKECKIFIFKIIQNIMLLSTQRWQTIYNVLFCLISVFEITLLNGYIMEWRILNLKVLVYSLTVQMRKTLENSVWSFCVLKWSCSKGKVDTFFNKAKLNSHCCVSRSINILCVIWIFFLNLKYEKYEGWDINHGHYKFRCVYENLKYTNRKS